MNPRTKAALTLVATIVLVSIATVFAKQTLENVHYLLFIWLQMTIACGFMLFIVGFSQKQIPRNIPIIIWVNIALIGLLNFSIVRAIFIYTLDILPATTHAYLINFVGVVTMVLSSLLLKERPVLLQVIGAVVALIGIRIYFWQAPAAEEVTGVIWLVVAVICLALTNILMRNLQNKKQLIETKSQLSNVQVSAYSIIVGTIPLILSGLFLDKMQSGISEISFNDWVVIIANSLVSVCLVMLVFNYALKTLKSYEASVLANSGVVFTAVFSAIILNEVIQINQILGIVSMLIGIAMVQYFHRRTNLC